MSQRYGLNKRKRKEAPFRGSNFKRDYFRCQDTSYRTEEEEEEEEEYMTERRDDRLTRGIGSSTRQLSQQDSIAHRYWDRPQRSQSQSQDYDGTSHSTSTLVHQENRPQTTHSVSFGLLSSSGKDSHQQRSVQQTTQTYIDPNSRCLHTDAEICKTNQVLTQSHSVGQQRRCENSKEEINCSSFGQLTQQQLGHQQPKEDSQCSLSSNNSSNHKKEEGEEEKRREKRIEVKKEIEKRKKEIWQYKKDIKELKFKIERIITRMKELTKESEVTEEEDTETEEVDILKCTQE